ncbi:MAG: hypothetical protein LAP40_13700 [Acidobacteriia bacterium]|nr:hypothetical protein [Terriglobia bacterium]
MSASLRVVRLGILPEVEESFDVQELASQAADALEAYQRAPWRQLSDRTRMAKLRRAIKLLQRIEGIETGRIPMPMWGD